MPSFKPSMPDAPDFVELMRSLAGAFQAVSMYDAAIHRESGTGLTPSQADVIFTLGGTDGMTCADLGEQTLITKGTLTGVIDRLRAKGLVERWEDAYDARRTIVALTRKGEGVYKKTLHKHLARLQERFEKISLADQRKAARLLGRIRQAFIEP